MISGMPTVQVQVQVQANVQWKCVRTRDGLHWVGSCDPLGLTVQSETYGELLDTIASTLDAILRDLLASNELDQFLRDKGWQVLSRDLIQGRPADVRFDVPFFPIPDLVRASGPQRSLHS